MTDPPPPPTDPDEADAAGASGYGFAVAAVAVALAAGLAAERVAAGHGAYSPYVLFAAAIALAAVRSGFRAGLLATLLSGLATAFFHLHPLYSFDVSDRGAAVLLLLFLLEGVALSAVSAALARGDREARGAGTRYGVAVGCVAAAVVLKLSLAPVLPVAMPFMLFYACVMTAAWYGGPGAGAAATGAAAGSAAFFFFEPRHSLAIADPERAGQLVGFLLEGGLISLFSRTVERNRHRAAASAEAARRYWEELRASERRLRRQNRVLADLARRPGEDDPDRAIRELTEAVAATVEVERVGVWLFDPARAVLRCLDLYERSPGRHTAGAELPAAQYPRYIRAIEENRSIAAHDARADERTNEFAASYLVPLGITSMLDAPLRLGGAVAGMVCLEHVGPPRRWAVEEEHFAGSVADFVALALKRRELKAAEAKLLRAQRMESIGALACGLAHDLNNLLTPVLMGAELLRTGGEQPEMLDMIRSSAERGGALLRQILSFARGSAATAGPLEVRPVVEQVAHLFRHTTGKQVRLAVEVAEFVRPVVASAAQLDQVLMNLCVNARDAMPDGGTLTIAVRNRELGPGAGELIPDGRPGTYVALDVADTGTGIPPEILGRIFDPFFTTKEPGRGTGLGLATTRDIVGALGGFVRVDSRVGRGTTFTVFLPAAGEHSIPKPDSAETPIGHGELVLVADDEASTRELACRVLEAYGYRAASASDGAEVVSRCREYGTDLRLVLLNVMMPGQPFGTTLAALRGEFPGVRLLLATGIGSRPEVPGLDDVAVLLKPYTSAQLLQAVRKVLGPPAT
jgi:signal transduction histidine kinase